MRYDRSVAGLLGHLNGGQRFTERANLIDFYEDRVADMGVDSTAQSLGVGDKKVIAHQLDGG